MKIRVSFSAHLRTAAGGAGIELELPAGARVGDAVTATARGGKPELASALLDASGKPRETLLLFLDDEQAAAGDALAEGVELTLVAPISGG
ncbi:MAG: MoaD/ThiS family protein [Planctomycetes bacterium]|nr:MoaD/ThiS family protein [Planctomycetota bacterium]